jgi:uncharacterized protein involved in tolerance to divalent cations
MSEPAILEVLCNLPDRDSAEALARALIEGRHAACVNILSLCRSVYRRKGAVVQLRSGHHFKHIEDIARMLPIHRGDQFAAIQFCGIKDG